ncbi:MAG: NAD-dependent succinate-semialdehyde dehydrogenase [Candidatus Kapabacteria bacterium]|nr:NAD-dependent succinate-semialdehyde dehydrogenase [Candidatus Kapabacteria bacterium]
MFVSTNPATEEIVGRYPAISGEECSHRLSESADAGRQWANTPLDERVRILDQLGSLLLRDDLLQSSAAMITSEMGKPIEQARAEVRKCASVCHYVVEHAHRLFAAVPVDAGFASGHVLAAPLGTILCIMPWNFPFWQFFRFAVPALAAGNSVLLKHAPTTWGSALAAVEICRMAGIPDGVVQPLMIDVEHIASAIASHHVHAVTFTGSTKAGAIVAEHAGRAVKKTVLELGGSDPYLVLDDANIDAAVEACVAGRMVNTGQSCVAAKRWIVADSLYDAFLERAKNVVAQHVVGDPQHPATTLGPIARPDLRDQLRRQVAESIEAGACYHGGGQSLPSTGYFVEPGILEAQPGTVAFDDELFGPVACLTRAVSDDHAIALANASVYGLGAAVFSSNTTRAHHVAGRIRSGMVFVNTFVRSDPRLPFGGVGMSGYGRELGHAGMMEFVNLRTIVRHQP